MQSLRKRWRCVFLHQFFINKLFFRICIHVEPWSSTPSLKNSGCETFGWNVGGTEFRMWDIRVECAMPHVVRGPSVCARCRNPSLWWHRARIAIRSNSIRILQEDTRRAPLSGLPQGEAHGTRDHHTPNDSISYPDMLSGSLAKVHKPCYVIPTACHSPHSAAIRWCVRTPCLDIFCMDSKELSSISDCFGDQKAIKTPKLNTLWLELIARVLNMLIGLKSDNYYSKVFKRVNYKLWNSTF